LEENRAESFAEVIHKQYEIDRIVDTSNVPR
jgi:hypothetical protein